jgi:tRNA pseudouridine(55) synthase
MFQGFLPVDKPVGARSSDCVDRIKHALGRGVKVGHGGTLDSTACGALVMLIGGATRLSAYVMAMPKAYRAVVRFGAETSTCDASGSITTEGDASKISDAVVDGILPSFIGWRMQTPPEVSAVRVNGVRAHKIFRSGGEPDIKPRPVFIESIKRSGSVSANREAEFLIVCGKGTYVRAIARDIGRRLGCPAHIASLRREAVGPFRAEESLRLGDSSAMSRGEILSNLKPLDFLENFLPRYSVSSEYEAALLAGREIPFTAARRETPGDRPPWDTVLVAGGSVVAVAGLGRSGRAVLMRPRVNIMRTDCGGIGQ